MSRLKIVQRFYAQGVTQRLTACNYFIGVAFIKQLHTHIITRII